MEPFSILAGAGLGGIKALFDSGRRQREQKLAAETQRYSPWTGLKADKVNWETPFSDVLSGGLTGLSIGQSLERQQKLDDLLQKMLDGKELSALKEMEGIPTTDEAVWTQLRGNPTISLEQAGSYA